MTKTVQIVTTDDNAAVYINGALVSGSTTTPPVPIPPPVPTIPPVPVNGPVIVVPWPVTGQVRKQTGNQENKQIKFQIQIPANLSVPKPNNLGFCRFTEWPGASYEARQVMIYVNGVLKFDTGRNGDTAPSVNYCINNPFSWRNVGGQFNIMPGELLEVVVQAYNWSFPENADTLFDFASPTRY